MSAAGTRGGPGPDAPAISADDLLTRAHAMELEAVDRYEEFVAQMELHGNLDVAALFRKLADIERKHADVMANDLTKRGIAIAPRAALAAQGNEGLETAPGDALHYLMTPYHALEIALENEQRAFDFFAKLASSPLTPEIIRLANEFAEEEKMHIALVREWLGRVPKPKDDWAYDPDEPRMPE
jgi:rubrerythrin